MNEPCGTVRVYTVCGKEARRLLFKERKERRRRRLLKRLIAEVRALRRALMTSGSNRDPR